MRACDLANVVHGPTVRVRFGYDTSTFLLDFAYRDLCQFPCVSHVLLTYALYLYVHYVSTTDSLWRRTAVSYLSIVYHRDLTLAHFLLAFYLLV